MPCKDVDNAHSQGQMEQAEGVVEIPHFDHFQLATLHDYNHNESVHRKNDFRRNGFRVNDNSRMRLPAALRSKRYPTYCSLIASFLDWTYFNCRFY